jgi:hypothetical protein
MYWKIGKLRTEEQCMVSFSYIEDSNYIKEVWED